MESWSSVSRGFGKGCRLRLSTEPRGISTEGLRSFATRGRLGSLPVPWSNLLLRLQPLPDSATLSGFRGQAARSAQEALGLVPKTVRRKRQTDGHRRSSHALASALG